MSVNARKNYYEILGVSPDSTFAEIKSAYRKLARKYHPDVNKASESVQKFKDITEAYEILSDKFQKQKYDEIYRKNFAKDSTNTSSATESSSYRYSASSDSEFRKNAFDKIDPDIRFKYKQKSAHENKQGQFKAYSNFSDNKPFKDVISNILDGISKTKKEKPNKKQPKNGDDINTEISISLVDSIRGCERVINVLHKELCPNCEGRRFINGARCSVCKGSGEFEQYKKITVKIQPNTKNGTKLRILHEGNPGFNGGVAGNLYLTVKVEANSNICIDGNNILYRMPLTPFEAVLGGKITVPVFEGKVILTVPPMTRTGQKFRLKGEGLKTNDGFGDMIITVEIQLPKTLSDGEVKLYEKLKKLSQGNIRDYFIHD